MVFIDYLTKWVEAFPLKDQTALTVTRTLVEEVITRHGRPREILSDRGPNFLSKLMDALFKLLKVKKINTTAYHPQTDGLVERFHQTLMDMLSKVTGDQPQDWDLHLPFVLFAYWTTQQESTRTTPFQLLYGREAEMPTSQLPELPLDHTMETPEGYLTDLKERMTAAWDAARQAINKTQDKQKEQYDKRAEEIDYQEGDIVYLFKPAQLRIVKLPDPMMDPTVL